MDARTKQKIIEIVELLNKANNTGIKNHGDAFEGKHIKLAISILKGLPLEDLRINSIRQQLVTRVQRINATTDFC